MHKIISGLAAVAALGLGAANANTIYTYTATNTNQQTDVGAIDRIEFSYSSNDTLSFSADLGQSTGAAANGGWFVLSPGTHPRPVQDELAIFYLDFTGGDVYTYRYDPIPGPSGSSRDTFLDPGRFVTSFQDVLTVTGDASGLSVSFSDLDLSALAPGTFGADWTGASFAESFGGWIHFTVLDAFTLDAYGRLSEFSPTLQSWLDIANQPTQVSEPVGLAALGMFGAIGVAAYRRKQRKAA